MESRFPVPQRLLASIRVAVRVICRPRSHRHPGFSSNSVATRGNRTVCRRASWTRPSNVGATPEQPAISRFRLRSVFRSSRCAVRASSAVRCRGRTVRRLRPTALRGPGPLGPRPARPALDQDPAHLRSAEPQAHLLHVDGVPDRAVADEQCHEPDAAAVHRAQPASRAAWTGSAWSSRSPMPGSAMAASDGWRPASSIRWRPCSSRRWATGCATNTACFGSRSSDGWQHEHPDNWLRRQDPWEISRRSAGRRGHARLHLRDASGQPADRRQSSLDPDRHSLRPAGGRLWRQDDQQPAAVGRGGARLLSTSRNSARATSSAPWSAASPRRP